MLSKFLPLSTPLQQAGEQELKFHLPKTATPSFLSWLNSVLDNHSDYPVTTICSIYFDTSDGASMLEKANSYYSKTKYRIRWYADAQGNLLPSPPYLEIKQKQGSARHKYRAPLPISAAELSVRPLDDHGFFDFFRRHCPSDLAPETPIRPVLELRYLRHRYGHPLFPSAFCLDSEIRCVRTNPAALPAPSGLPLDHDVFEQKGGSADVLPILRALPRFGARRMAISKYFLTLLQLQPDSPYA